MSRILIVDDEEGIRRSLAGILGDEGFDTVGVADGEAAITPHVRIDADGVTLITPRTDMGQGAYSMQAALIAEELDIELEQVKVLADPLRVRILETMALEERTTKQVAEELGEKPTRLYPHVEALAARLRGA